MGLNPEIYLYITEDGGYTEEREEAEILVICNSILTAYKQNFVKRKFSYINTFDHEGPAVVSAMHNLTSGVFEHPEITSPIYVYQRVMYM